MKKLWFRCLAVMIGLGACANAAHAQYSSGYSNIGPSSYPAQNTYMNNVPQVPQSFNAHAASTYGAGNYRGNYQLVGTGDVYGTTPTVQPEVVPTPQPYGHAPATSMAPATVGPSVHSHGTEMGATQMHQAPVQQHYGPQAHAAPMQHHAPMHQAVPHAPHAGSLHPTPAPAYGGPVAGGCTTCNQPGYNYAYAPSSVGPPMGASIAPHAVNCGPAPVSSYNCGPAPVAKQWFATADVLLFNRVDTKNKPLSFNDSIYAPNVLTTGHSRHRLAAGFQTTIGRYFNCGRNAIALSYWGLFPETQTTTQASATAGTFRSRIPYTYMTLAGTPVAPATPYSVYDWYDNAYTHTLQRSSQYHNVEVNLLGFAAGCASRNFNIPTKGSMFTGLQSRGCGYCGGAGCGHCGGGYGGSCGGGGCNTCGPSVFATGPCNLRAPQCGSPLNVTWLAGVRWFRFQDDLLYAASLYDTVINRAADDLYYEVNTLNDLVGFQTGFRMDYCLAKRCNLYARTKVGIYNNRSNLYTRLGTDYQHAYLADTRTPTNPNNGQNYIFDVTKNQIAFLSELGTGVGFRINCNWSATFGYQAVIASGVATAPDNVRTQFAAYADVQDFHNHGTLILHGFNLGTTYNF